MVGIPESFKVLLSELKSLCLNIEPIDVVVDSGFLDSEIPEDISLNEEVVEIVKNDGEDSVMVDTLVESDPALVEETTEEN